MGGEGGAFCAGSVGVEGGGFCARSVGGEGGGGGGDSARVFLDRFDELLLLLSPFRSFSCSSLTLSFGWLGSSCCFLENDLRGGGGGSSTSVGCDSNCTCSTCSVVGLLLSSFSSSTVCIPMFSMLKVLLSSVLGVSPPVLCTEGGSGEMGGPAVLWYNTEKNKTSLVIGQVTCYCETHKTVNTRNIYGMLLCCEELVNEARDN